MPFSPEFVKLIVGALDMSSDFCLSTHGLCKKVVNLMDFDRVISVRTTVYRYNEESSFIY